MRPYHFTTGTATPALTALGNSVDFQGLSATSAESAAFYVKLWWQHIGNTTVPIIGTTVPDLTIQVPTTGLLFAFSKPLNPGGPCWVAATKNAVDTDDTALTAGGDVITLFLD